MKSFYKVQWKQKLKCSVSVIPPQWKRNHFALGSLAIFRISCALVEIKITSLLLSLSSGSPVRATLPQVSPTTTKLMLTFSRSLIMFVIYVYAATDKDNPMIQFFVVVCIQQTHMQIDKGMPGFFETEFFSCYILSQTVSGALCIRQDPVQ